MVEVTGTLQRQAWVDGVLPPVEVVRPGLWSIPVPIPANPLRYVLVYAFELPDGVAIVDAGWDAPEAWQALVDGLTTAGYATGDVRGVLVTHIHPDHYGLAGRVREASGAWVALHPEDAKLLPERYGDVQDLQRRMHDQLAENGVPPEVMEALSGRAPSGRDKSRYAVPNVSFAQPDVLLDDGEYVPLPGVRLRTVWTPGHSPGHVCFLDPERRLLLSGDHVLPRISPNIAVHTLQRSNPLADFLEALEKVRALDVDEVLPAHEYRFRGLEGRVADLVAHHGERLDELAGLLRAEPGLTCWELAQRLSWSRPWEEIRGFMQRAALGETLAHLVLLVARGRAVGEGRDPRRWSPAS